MDFVALASYESRAHRPGGVRIIKDLDAPIAGRDVIVVENVVDTGLTLNYLLRALSLRNPRDLAVCTLLDRPYRRLVDDLPVRYVGFTVPDELLAGYGLGVSERTRAHPDLRLVRSDRK